MAVLGISGFGPNISQTVNLSTLQATNADSTNTLDRGGVRSVALLQITTVAGATPTVTVNIMGSMDGTNFFNIAYATTAAPETVAVAALVLNQPATTVQYYILRAAHPWRYLKLVYSANTNMQVTSDVTVTSDPYIT
jgi:hypothetical protein